MSGHILLASLCVASLLANVLAIALGALFNERPVFASYNTTMHQSMILLLNRTVIPQPSVPAGFYSHFYVTMANLSSGTSLTPWTDTGFTYFPFFALDSHDNSSFVYRAETRGFGVEAVCNEIDTSPGAIPYANYSLYGDGYQNLDVMIPYSNGSTGLCSPVQVLLTNSRLNESGPIIPGPLAQEVTSSLRNQSSDGEPGPCERLTLLSWMRVDPADPKGSLKRPMYSALPCYGLRCLASRLTRRATCWIPTEWATLKPHDHHSGRDESVTREWHGRYRIRSGRPGRLDGCQPGGCGLAQRYADEGLVQLFPQADVKWNEIGRSAG